jgi:hypothetical protein
MVDVDTLMRLGRRAWRRAAARRRFPAVVQSSLPVLFGNSFPKSGTHLLTQILAGFTALGPVVESGLPPVLTFEGESGRPRPLAAIHAQLGRLLPGDVAYGHLHAYPEVVAELCSPRFASYFIYRDPRDVVVSHVFYVTDLNNRHVHHAYYAGLPDFEARLRVSILGRPELDVPFPNVAARFEPYLPWLERREMLSLRYEDLLADLEASLQRIFAHALGRGFQSSLPEQQAVARLAAAVQPERSPTFRSGRSGGWRDHFSNASKELFKEVTGDLLIRLGYEQNQNW